MPLFENRLLTSPWQKPEVSRRLLMKELSSVRLIAVFIASLFIVDYAIADALLTTRPALTVSTVSPLLQDWPIQITANGSIAAWQEAIVGAEMGGLRLTDVLVNVGDGVHKGQALAHLQHDTLEADHDQTRANLAEMAATLEEATANARRARQMESRGALSPQSILQSLTAEKTARARVDALIARLKSEQLHLDQTRIVAPDDGTISSRSATLGAVPTQGQELFRLIRNDRLEWRAELTAADLVQIKNGMPVQIMTTSQEIILGSVRMVAPTLNPQTRTGLVYVDLNHSGNAKAGMFAHGTITLAHRVALTLPQSAVMLRDGFSYVYSVGPDHRITQTKVTVGRRSAAFMEISSGLAADVRVVRTGVGFLTDGDLVTIVPDVATNTP